MRMVVRHGKLRRWKAWWIRSKRLREAGFRYPVYGVTRDTNIEIAGSAMKSKRTGLKNFVAVDTFRAVAVVVVRVKLTELGRSAASGAYGEVEKRGDRMMVERASREE